MVKSIKIEYSLYNPMGNITCLIWTFVQVELQPTVAKLMMAHEPCIQQVGFVTLVDGGISLRMAGGELCGNAAMCAAVHYLKHVNQKEGDVKVYSNIPEVAPIDVSLSLQSENNWRGSVSMPRPLSLELDLESKYPVVRLPGITHMLVELKDIKLCEPLEYKFKPLAISLSKKYNSAFGVIFYNLDQFAVVPMVYEPSVGTVIWESSCSSGTAALGAYLARYFRQPVDYTFDLPSGRLTVQAAPDGEILMGDVELWLPSLSVTLEL